MEEQMKEAFYLLAEMMEENQEREAQAVKGYTKQLALIDECVRLSSDEETAQILEKLAIETKEKIADELNHQSGLIQNYTYLTGISAGKE